MKRTPACTSRRGQQAALAELTTVLLPQGAGLLIKLEVPHEARTGQAQGFTLRLFVFPGHHALRRFFQQWFQQGLPPRGAIHVHPLRARESRRSKLRVRGDRHNHAAHRESPDPGSHWEIPEHVGRNVRIGRAALLGHDSNA